ncbi:MAG: 4'-phosphopantetheinyl transferase superfamily protein [Fibrobacterales bacterium]|nr:4'-phosphopantetheinyl transferase superfamily protein [Fibrobacterales bacterium]
MEILLTEFADVSPLADDGLFARAMERVPEWRRAKVRRLRRPEARRLSLGAGLLLARAMKAADVPLDAEIAFDTRGKPFYPDFPRFHFCLSHSGERALCASSPREVGCDIQKVDPSRLKNRRLVARTIGAESLALFDALDEESRVRAFFSAWGMDEALFKLDGTRPSGHSTETLAEFSDEGFFCAIPGHCLVVCAAFSDDEPVPDVREVDLRKFLRSRKR